MTTIKPFKAIRPTVELASKVAALPYDVMTSEEAREVVKGNPYSFLHVDKAEIDLDPAMNPYDSQVYEKARSNLLEMIENGILIPDSKDCFYIYRLTMCGRSQTGIVACSSIDDYLENRIKKHELTRADKEQDRIQHIEHCQAQTGPIFLCYRYQEAIATLMSDWMSNHDTVYDFVAEDDVAHAVWEIDDQITIDLIVDLFAKVNCLYIADGHHRSASAVKAGLKKREQLPSYSGDEPFNYFLSVIFADKELAIMDYNRVVKDLNGLSVDELLARIGKKFLVTSASDSEGYKPSAPYHYGMYVAGSWFELIAKDECVQGKNLIESLDVSILQNEILEPILGIHDVRTDKRIDFVGGIRGVAELAKRVDSGEMQIAFSLYPVSVAQLMDIADGDQIMPPKSTWFEPKLRSGLFVNRI